MAAGVSWLVLCIFFLIGGRGLGGIGVGVDFEVGNRAGSHV